MNRQKLAELIKIIVESINEEIEEMWLSTNEDELTSEMRDQLKVEITDCLMEYLQECGDSSIQHNEPLSGPQGPSTAS